MYYKCARCQNGYYVLGGSMDAKVACQYCMFNNVPAQVSNFQTLIVARTLTKNAVKLISYGGIVVKSLVLSVSERN